MPSKGKHSLGHSIFHGASLSLKILIPTILSTAVIITAFTIYLIGNQRMLSEAQLKNKADNISKLLAYSNINTLWNYDIDELKNISNSFFQDRDIVKITIKDYKGTTYADFSKDLKGTKKISQTLLIKKGNETLGKLYTEFTNYYIEKNLATIKNKLILLSLFIFFVLTFIIVLTSKIALKPLNEVLEGISHISRGDYSHQIKTKSRDEIGQLSEQFNQMSKQILILQDNAVKAAAHGKEMEIAKNIQLSLQPNLENFSNFGFEISANMTPAEDIGGDYYDLILSKDKKLWFGVGDVTGHGLVAGLIMMMAQVAANTLIRSVPGLTPQKLLIDINRIIQTNIRNGLKKDHHMTISFIKEEKQGLYSYAGAHEIILIYRAQTGEIDQIPTRGMWLGVIEDISKPTEKYAGTFTLEKNDILFLYTDGVIEIRNSSKEQYDITRLAAFIQNHANLSTHAMKIALLDEINRFKQKQSDDITFLIMKKE